MYAKEAISIDHQIQQLIKRGLEINEADNAEQVLNNISYYRLSGYWLPMQSDKENHIFKLNSRFSDVIALYHFDRELRLLLFDIIERIEISLRTKLIYHLPLEFDAWWFQKTELFINSRELIKTLAALEEEIERSKDIFIREHYKKHKDDQRFPPGMENVGNYQLWKLVKIIWKSQTFS